MPEEAVAVETRIAPSELRDQPMRSRYATKLWNSSHTFKSLALRPCNSSSLTVLQFDAKGLVRVVTWSISSFSDWYTNQCLGTTSLVIDAKLGKKSIVCLEGDVCCSSPALLQFGWLGFTATLPSRYYRQQYWAKEKHEEHKEQLIVCTEKFYLFTSTQALGQEVQREFRKW
jgi:hypothetical protein